MARCGIGLLFNILP